MFQEQAILSARFPQRLMVTFCVAVLILMYSSHDILEYEAAIKEINVLLSLDENDFILGKVRGIHPVYAHFWMSLGDLLNKNSVSFHVFDRTSNKKHLFDVKEIPPSFEVSSLEKIDNYFNNLTEISVTINGGWRKILPPLERKLGEIKRNNGIITNLSILIPDGEFDHHYKLLIDGGEIPFFVEVHQPTDDHNVSIPVSGFKYLEEIGVKEDLVKEFQRNLVFMPNLKTMWSQLRSQTPIEARATLLKKAIPDHRRLEVFGLSIPISIVATATPIIIFSLSLYFLVHLNFLQLRIAENSSTSVYPWVIIMPGFLAFLISVIITFFLPIFTMFFTVSETWEHMSNTLRIISTCVSLGVIPVLLIAVYKISKIRSAN